MADTSRAAMMAEGLRQKQKLVEKTSSSASVDEILGKIKTANTAHQNNNMQVFGLEEEVAQKQEEIRGLYLKNKVLVAKISEMHEVEEANKTLELKNKELEEANKKLKAEVISLKDKNQKVLQTAKDHQKGWKDHISSLEASAVEKDKENKILKGKMAKLIKNLEVTIADFSDLHVGASYSLSLASTSESDDCESIVHDSVETMIEKGDNLKVETITESAPSKGCNLLGFQAAAE
jgi:predicted RNase H-like nuclease (RuvC/YqgF family)